VDIYDKTWTWLQENCIDSQTCEPSPEGFFLHPFKGRYILDQFETVFSSFFLVYSNRNYPASQNLDYFYAKQEENGAIRWKYDMTTGEPVFDRANPEGAGLPLFAWAEFNLFHKSANKKRVKDVMPILKKYMDWIDGAFKAENGLYEAPFASSTMFNAPRKGAHYCIDFNAALAVNALFMASLGDILNDKDLMFQYKRMYFSLKTRINTLMWSPETNFYHDLDLKGARLPVKTIAGFWPLLAEIPNEERADKLIGHLTNPKTFGTEHPFPTLSADSPEFSENGEGFKGSVVPPFTFMVIKGLERYEHFDLARECTIRHLYLMLDTLMPHAKDSKEEKGDLWEAYKPCKEGRAVLAGSAGFPKRRHLLYAGLSTIALMIENVIGLSISLHRKTVDWIIPNLEIMGIENLSLKRNMITILSNKSLRGWEIQMESEKLYYFTINILGQKKKTLPIPSGKCSMLIDKL
jgi:neutral trehalase